MTGKAPNVWQKFWKRITDVWNQFIGIIDGLIGNKFIEFLNKIIPPPLRFLLPFLRDDLGLAPPSITSFKGIGVPEKIESKEVLKEITIDQRVGTIWQIKPQFLRYQCQESNPFRCEFPHQAVTDDPNNKYCKKCQFPASLPSEVKVRGRSGVYQVDNYIGIRGTGRLYNATNLTNGEEFLFKEYVIPKKYFNDQETRACKRNFEISSELKLSDGRTQDSRLITPIEAIADAREERCYAILPRNDEAIVLAEYLAGHGAMSNWQVKSFLNQALQTLESLHSQKYRLRSGIVTSGLPHGNLSFYSIAIRTDFQGFTVYLNDMALWEDRFYPPDVQTPAYSINRDLEDLGYIAFYLLKGGVIDLENRSCLSPYEINHWDKKINLGLKKFIQNLIGFGEVSYSSAEIARRALLRIPIERDAMLEFIDKEEVVPVKKKWWGWITKKIIAIAIAVTLLLLLLLLLYFWLNQPPKTANLNAPCCINQISDIPKGKFTYTADKHGSWNYTLLQDNLIAKGATLEDELKKRQPKLQLKYQPIVVDKNSNRSPITQLQSNQADFAISSVTDNLDGTFITQDIAYDGLTVFVAFSYAQRDNSLPTALQGRLSFSQLRQLYTGEIINWRQLGGPNLPVKLYMPLDNDAIAIFEKRVLKDEEAIAAFRQLIQEGNNGITSLSVFDSLRQVIQDFEDRSIGSISFGSISQVFGQCSVYPLAIADDNKPFISPLMFKSGKAVTPNVDLCNEKGSYIQNYSNFINQTYPLAYPISVVYTRDNRRLPIAERFIAIMRTDEAQNLLKQTGLIPLKFPIKSSN
ncbi:PstS family phosphate ABC transporter substrate-binding protein [Pseudanabaena sp. 'Roaring Creek']|uniref:PstS family phosphate ABC transporter substrate-binding protein n=1 Tax=Pseudanabaena sp. 'Roaring Creek' TaxID=1681830 RepID=UPI0006D86374|nr:substrate-binding domain-containing protein [Pseudanabaena sp. 'Roaring Creek']